MLITLAFIGLLAAAGPDWPCTVSRVVDGDTYYGADGLKVRSGSTRPSRHRGGPGASPPPRSGAEPGLACAPRDWRAKRC